VAAVTLIGMALTLAACSSGGSASPSGSSTTSTTQAASATTSTTAPTPTTTTASGGAAPAGTTAITIKNFAFSPSTVTVAPGASVTVTNKDQVAHTITAVDGKFDTGDIQPGASKTFTAPNTAGSYPYICSIHQYMMGTLTVS
jgi:plastocyanin